MYIVQYAIPEPVSHKYEENRKLISILHAQSQHFITASKISY